MENTGIHFVILEFWHVEFRWIIPGSQTWRKYLTILADHQLDGSKVWMPPVKSQTHGTCNATSLINMSSSLKNPYAPYRSVSSFSPSSFAKSYFCHFSSCFGNCCFVLSHFTNSLRSLLPQSFPMDFSIFFGDSSQICPVSDGFQCNNGPLLAPTLVWHRDFLWKTTWHKRWSFTRSWKWRAFNWLPFCCQGWTPRVEISRTLASKSGVLLEISANCRRSDSW